MDRLSEITLVPPVAPDVPYADAVGVPGGADERLTLNPPQPCEARPATAFVVADVPAPEIA
ncbi:hypothetical protein AB0J74_14670 [Asanoa sp. NPDC049573]|uniref:hypothetical protein n=1 Tax=Asanoa sp. NPDC049573 TaxID=3155396 RepID=UPI00341D254B